MTTDETSAALPVRIRPRPAETAESFVLRLAVANHLRPSYLRRHLTPGRQGMGPIDPDKLATACGRSMPVVLRMFPEFAARRQPPRQPGHNAEQRKRKQRNDTARRKLYEAIRRDAVAGLSGRELERKHNVGWHTVQAALKSPNPPARKKYPERPRPSLQGLEAHIDELLAASPNAPVRELWEHLLDQHHAAITYEAVRGYVVNRRGPSPRPPLPVIGHIEIPTTTDTAATTGTATITRDPASFLTHLAELTLELSP